MCVEFPGLVTLNFALTCIFEQCQDSLTVSNFWAFSGPRYFEFRFGTLRSFVQVKMRMFPCDFSFIDCCGCWFNIKLTQIPLEDVGESQNMWQTLSKMCFCRKDSATFLIFDVIFSSDAVSWSVMSVMLHHNKTSQFAFQREYLILLNTESSSLEYFYSPAHLFKKKNS